MKRINIKVIKLDTFAKKLGTWLKVQKSFKPRLNIWMNWNYWNHSVLSNFRTQDKMVLLLFGIFTKQKNPILGPM